MCNDAETWLVNCFAEGISPPFSFQYAGKSSKPLLKDWCFSHRTSRLDDARTERLFTYTDPESLLQVRCECVLFKDFSAAEWVLRLRNSAEADTKIIADIQSLDASFTRNLEGDFVLHRSLGSNARREDFAPIHDVVKPHFQVKLVPVGGRSSNTTALPFFNIEFPGEGCGLVVGIGWSGQWAASFARDEGSSIRVKIGLELTHLKLHPGEEIRTPRILLLSWRGDDYLVGQNLLRRFILVHHMPKRDGKPVTLPFACSASALYDEANKATEQNQVDFASRFQRYGVEYLWIDAGWFEGGWPNGVGNWFVRKDGFPRGLRAVSDALKKMGMGLIVWFEPERVHQGTWLDREHPEWVLRLPGNPNGLLNLGDEEVRRWLTQHIAGMINSEGVSVYRQDFNMDPLPYWRAVDDVERQGITEIRYVEGLYAFWDELLKRHPGLIIDNCASGGRRIDLETVTRSVALWRTDYQYFEPNGYQSHTYGISLWLPSTSTGSGYPEEYSFRSSINNGVALGWNPYQPDVSSLWSLPFPVEREKPFPVEQARHLAEEFKSIRHFFLGDFYPLTQYSVADDVWIAYQFHREDLKQGIVLAFRRHKSLIPTTCLKLKGLQPAVNYDVYFKGSDVRRVFTGKGLTKGLEVVIEGAPGSSLIIYRQVQ